MKIVPSYPSNYISIDISEKIKAIQEKVGRKLLKYIFIRLELDTTNYSALNIEILDKSLHKRINLGQKFFTGDPITIVGGKVKVYLLEINKNENLEDISNPRCKNYKSPEDFAACDTKFVKDHLQSIGWGNITPIWATDDLNEVTDDSELFSTVKTIFRDVKTKDILYGDTKNDCPFPCVSRSIESKRLRSITMNKNNADIKLCFHGTYKNIVEEKVKFDMMVMLSLSGGNMGLWMGLSIVQMIDMAIDKLTLVLDITKKY